MDRGVRGFFVLVVLLLTIVTVSATDYFPDANDISRIADFDNDGFYEALAHSDRIDTSLSTIRYFDQYNNGSNFFEQQVITADQYQFCSMMYQDSDQDQYQELFYSCQDEDNNITGFLYEYNGTEFVYQTSFGSDLTSVPNPSLSDTLFLDFNGDQRADILSCFHVNSLNQTLVYIANGTNFTEYATDITIGQFYDGTDYACSYVPLDYDGDGDFDIITYTYNGDNITFYENTQNVGSLFNNDTNTSYYNVSFFEGKRIKALAAFDSNQDGFSDLAYVIDTGETNGNRDIEFGQLINQHRLDQQERTMTDPFLINITTFFENDSKVYFSWDNQSGAADYISLNISQSVFQINGVNTSLAPFTQLVFNSSNFTFGSAFESSYDRNALFGNVRYQNSSINYTLPIVQYNISLTGIAPSQLKQVNSSIYNYTPVYTHRNASATAFGVSFTIELCDGLDNDGDGEVDEDFYLTWPDNTTKLVQFDTEGDGRMVETYTFTKGSYSAVFNCTEQSIRTGNALETSDAIINTGNDDNSGGSSGGGSSSLSGTVGGGASSTTGATDTGTGTGGGTGPVDPAEPQQESSSKTLETQEVFNTNKDGFETFTKVTYNNKRTYIREEIKNIERTIKYDIEIRKIIPKEVLKSASDITYTGIMDIIQDDPIVDFKIEQLDYLESHTLLYSLPGTIAINKLNTIETVFTSEQAKTEEQIELEEDLKQQTANESLIIRTREEIINNKTEFTIEVDLKDNISQANGVEIEQYIPKCIIAEITDQILEAAIDPALLDSVEIKEADPIIVWNLKNVDRNQELKLKLDAFRDEDCDDEFKVKVLASSYIRENQEVDEKELVNALILTISVIFFFVILFFLATHEPYKHQKPHIHRLVKIILHRTHRGASNDEVTKYLLSQDESKADIKEAFAHVSDKLKHKFIYHIFKHGLEIVIFLTLLVLNIMDFTGAIPGYIDWVKKIISIILILFILYKVDITKILFNNSSKNVNLAIILTMLILHLKNLVQFAKQGLEQDIGFVYSLYGWIWNNHIIFELYLFIIGTILLFLISIYIAKKLQVREGCLYFLFTKHTSATTIGQVIVRTCKVFFILLLFFFLIFNRIVEWLAISIDATVFVLATLILFFLLFATTLHSREKRHVIFHSIMNTITQNMLIYVLLFIIIIAFIKPFLATDIIMYIYYTILAIFIAFFFLIAYKQIKQEFSGLEHVSTAVDSLYEKFLKLFHYPQTILLGISGLFILQNVVEVALYLIPNITGHTTHLYLAHGEQTLLTLFSESSIIATHLFDMSFAQQLLYGMTYFFSLIGFFYIFLIPIFVWVLYFTHRHIHPSKFEIQKTLFAHHHWTQRIGKIIVTTGIPLIILSFYTKLLSIEPILNESSTGVLILAQEIVATPIVVYVLVLFLAVYMILISFVLHKPLMRTIVTYATFWFGIGVNVWIYLIPTLESLIAYLHGLSIIMLEASGITTVISGFILFFFGLDALLVFGLGISTLIFFVLPPKAKQSILYNLTKIKYLRRIFFLSNDMMFLEYYDEAREKQAGNLLHHVLKYLRTELRAGHHLETIILQLKIHHYPNEFIDEAIEDIIKEEESLITVMPAKSVNPTNVQFLVKAIRKHHLKKPFEEVLETFEDEYAEVEIKLAFRYAYNNLKGDITANSIEEDFVRRTHKLHGRIENLKKQKLSKAKIVTTLTHEGYDPELILRIYDAKQSKVVRMKQLVTLIDEIESIADEKTREVDLASAFSHYSSEEIAFALSHVKNGHKKNIIKSELVQLRKLVDWIKKAKEKKYANDKILKLLVSEGWDKVLVESVLQTDIHTHSDAEIDEMIEHQYLMVKKERKNNV